MVVVLLNFPIELLTLIFNRPASSQHVITLWKCGSHELNRRLVKCITNITLVDTRVTSSSRYPKLISSFPSLRTLDVDRGRGYLTGSPHHIFNELLKLPHEMTSISILAEDAVGCLDDADGEPFDWSTVFPELLTLRIEFYTTKQTRSLPILPPKLETFAYSRTWSYFNEEQCAELPKSLTAFDSFPLVSELPLHHPRRPHGMTLPFAIVYLTSDYEGCLPTHLKSMSVSAVQPDFGPPVYEADWIAFLPPTLESLYLYNVGYFTANAISRLPKSFKSLTGEVAVDWPSFAELERAQGLKQVLQVWPPNLTTLGTFRTFCTNDDLRYIPATLTSLCLNTDRGLDLQGLNTPSLRSLKLILPDSTEEDIRFHYWPPTLETLHFTGYLKREDSIYLRTHLPESLRTLIFHCDYYDYDDEEEGAVVNAPLPAPILPIGLTALEVKYLDEAWLLDLPDTLTSLAITASMILSNSTDLWLKLPFSLQLLLVEYHFHSDLPLISSHSFAHLTHLHTLVMPSVYRFPRDVLEHLPSTLKRLTLTLAEGAAVVANPPTGFEFFQLTGLTEAEEQQLAQSLSLNTQTKFAARSAQTVRDLCFQKLRDSIKF